MTSLNNLEKLIQMATIEQMYSMLQKMKNEFTKDAVEEKNNDQDNGPLLNEIAGLSNKFDNHNIYYNEQIKKYDAEIWKLSETIKFLSSKIEYLETDLTEIKSNSNNNSKYLCQQIRGQQTLNSYLGISSEKQPDSKEEEEHIKLKIEEMKCEDSHTQDVEQLIKTEEEEEEEVEEEEEEEEVEEEVEEEEEVNANLDTVTCSTILSVPQLVIESKQEDDEEVEEEDEEEDEKVEEEDDEVEEIVKSDEETDDNVSEEEVGTEEDVKEIVKEEEEEEEVFEIEIDDVTYFATHEENGILYEIASDGDVGKKVGIIKDGEPIFN
jgi:hypothetical protein